MKGYTMHGPVCVLRDHFRVIDGRAVVTGTDIIQCRYYDSAYRYELEHPLGEFKDVPEVAVEYIDKIPEYRVIWGAHRECRITVVNVCDERRHKVGDEMTLKELQELGYL